MAADTKERRGLYVGLGAVQAFLRQCQLQRLLPDADSDEELDEELGEPEFDSESDRLLVEDSVPNARRGLAALQSALNHSDADIVCLVRSARGSQSDQRIVVLSGKPVSAELNAAKRRAIPSQ